MSLKIIDPLRYRVRFLVLLLLSIKPSYGYEILKRLEEITLGLVKGGPGTVYPVLKELKEEGLIVERIVTYKGRSRKVYEITGKGAQELMEGIELFHRVVHNLIELMGEARRKLSERYGTTEEPLCPSEKVLVILKKLNRLLSMQVKRLEERMKECQRVKS